MAQNAGRLLLIYPDPHDANATIASSNFSLTLGMLGGALKLHGYSVDYRLGYLHWRRTWMPIDEDLTKYDIVGISVNSFQLSYANEMAAQIKAKHPEIFVVGGGAHATFEPKDLLSKGFDVVVRGEGELTAVELMGYLMERKRTGQPLRSADLLAIQGVSFLDPETRELRNSPDRPMIKDLETLPFADWEQDDYVHILEDQHRVVSNSTQHGTQGLEVIASPTFESSRGCPYSCIFCSTSMIKGKTWRGKTPERVVAEVDHFVEFYKRVIPGGAAVVESKKAHILGIYIDDNYAIDRKRALAIGQGFKKLPVTVRWNIMTVAQTVQDPTYLRALLDVGLNLLYFGMESGYAEGLRRVKKGTTMALLDNTVSLMRQVPIRRVTFSFIVGFPWENRPLAFMTIRKAFEIQFTDPKKFHVPIYTMTPFAGTEIAEPDMFGVYVTSSPLSGMRKAWGFEQPHLNDVDCHDFSIMAYLIDSIGRMMTGLDYAVIVKSLPTCVALLAESQSKSLRKLGERFADEVRAFEYGVTTDVVLQSCIGHLKKMIEEEIGDTKPVALEKPRKVGPRPLPLVS